MNQVTEDTSQRRRKILRLSYHDVLNAVLGTQVIAGVVKVPSLGLPKGTKCAQLWYEPQANNFCAMLTHPSWEVVPLGVDPEIITGFFENVPVADSALDASNEKLQGVLDDNKRFAFDLAAALNLRDTYFSVIQRIGKALGMKEEATSDDVLQHARKVGEDIERLTALENLMRNCPHTEVEYREGEEKSEAGYFAITTDGCESSQHTGNTLREAIDKEVKYQREFEAKGGIIP